MYWVKVKSRVEFLGFFFFFNPLCHNNNNEGQLHCALLNSDPSNRPRWEFVADFIGLSNVTFFDIQSGHFPKQEII